MNQAGNHDAADDKVVVVVREGKKQNPASANPVSFSSRQLSVFNNPHPH
jgi:hypothetical protein